MNQISVNEEYKIKSRTPIAALSIISLICTLLSCATYFADYKSALSFPFSVQLLFSVLTLIPSALMTAYVFYFYKNPKMVSVIPIVITLIAILSILGIFSDSFFGVYRYGVINEDADGSRIVTSLLNVPIRFFTAIFFVLARLNASKGFRKKSFITIASIIKIIIGIWALIAFIMSVYSFYEMNEVYVYLFSVPAGYISYITLGGALLLFALNNTIPCLNKKEKQNMPINTVTVNAEQELKTLNDRRDAGLISEEKYTEQRAEIIRRL